MTNREIAVLLEGTPGVTSAEERYGNQVEVRVSVEGVVSLLSFLKASGFEHLSNILAVDWIAEGEMEVVYNLFSYRHRVHATVKLRLDRDNPHAPTLLALWPQAQVYEREVHEFFGIVFDGNPNLEPFFLHNWLDAPPLRKDFDTEEYSRQAYGMLEEESAGPAANGHEGNGMSKEQTR